MLANIYYQVIASTYGSGPYNSSTYDSTASTGSGSTGTTGTTTTTGQANGNSNGGATLVDTGVVVFAFVGIAAIIILTAIIIRVWKRKPATHSAK